MATLTSDPIARSGLPPRGYHLGSGNVVIRGCLRNGCNRQFLSNQRFSRFRLLGGVVAKALPLGPSPGGQDLLRARKEVARRSGPQRSCKG